MTGGRGTFRSLATSNDHLFELPHRWQQSRWSTETTKLSPSSDEYTWSSGVLEDSASASASSWAGPVSQMTSPCSLAAKQAPLGRRPGTFASGAARRDDRITFVLFVVYNLLFASSSVLFVIARFVCGGATSARSRAMAH